MSRYLIAFFILFNFAPLNAAVIKHHQIFDLRGALGDTKCELWAEELGREFASRAGVVVRGTLCEEGPVTKSIDIIISYESDHYIPVSSTYTMANNYAKKGIYKSKEECLANLEEDKNFFIQQTGLAPYATFCSSQDQNAESTWFAHIEAIGTSDIVPMRAGWESGQPYGISKDQMFFNIQKRLRNFDIQLQHLTWSRGFSGLNMALFAYAIKENSRISLFSTKAANIIGLNECLKKAENFQNEILSRGKFPILTTYCSSRYSEPKSFDIEMIALGFNFISLNRSVETYKSDEECESNRLKIERKYAIAYGENKIIGSVCEGKQIAKETFFNVVIVNKN